MEVAKKIYIGNGETGERRLRNIKKIATRYFGGSVSKLFNDALNKVYRLDSETGEELTDREFRVAEPEPPPYPYPRSKSKRSK